MSDYKTAFVPGTITARREFADGSYQVRVGWLGTGSTNAGTAWVACTKGFYETSLVGYACEIRPGYSEYDPEWRRTIETPAAVAYVEYFGL